MTLNPLALTKQLINIKSITPNDNGCQDIIRSHLKNWGFNVIDLSQNKVTNTLAIKGDSGPLFLFSGHTDVVPPGPQDQWQSDPFEAQEREGYLYGRGSADMKTGIAAMLCAFEQFVAQDNNNIRLAMAITSDEEGDAIDGSKVICEYLKAEKIIPDYVVIGEATSLNQLGDTVKTGRRGSLSCRLNVIGKQCHIAYPQNGENPIHASAKIISALSHEIWDQGNQDFEPTSFQVSNIHSGTGANNVIPEISCIDFNFRFCPESTITSLKARTEAIAQAIHSNLEFHWQGASTAFQSPKGELLQAATTAINTLCQIDTLNSTQGGSSDGKFFAPLGSQIVELGPINASIHKINENVKIEDIETLANIYLEILKHISDVTA